MKSKKGLLMDNELLEFILAAAVIAGLVIGFFALFSPDYDVVKETSESYYDSLVEQIEIAENGGKGVFSPLVLGDKMKEAVQYYVVYFGDKFTVRGGKKGFSSFGKFENRVCICYEDAEGGKCGYCEDLDGEASLDGVTDGWFVPMGDIEIEKKEDVYEFRKG